MENQQSTKVTVELFDCVLRHGGNKDHEIPKKGVSLSEIKLLKSMHGEEAVLDRDVKPAMNKGQRMTREMSPRDELFDLARRYANTADPMSGKKVVERVFVTSLIGFDVWLEEQLQLEEMEREEARQKANEDLRRARREQALAAA